MQKKTMKRVGGLALGSSMLILSMIPASAAFAATNNYISNVETSANGMTVSATSTTMPKGLHVWYQFRATTPSGHTWILRKFEASNTMQWTPPQSGTYTVQAFALTQYQVATKQWGNAVAGTVVNDSQDQVASLSIAGAPTASIAPNTAETLTVVAKDASGNAIANPGTPKWSLNATSGATLQDLANGGAVFDATAAGSYTITATLDGKTATATIVVYGLAAAVNLTPATPSIVADGSATDTITATVADSNGHVVSDFNGRAELIVPTNHATFVGGTNSGGYSFVWVDFTNGVGTVTLTAGKIVGAATIISELLSSTNGQTTATNVSYGTTAVNMVAPTAAGLSLTASNPSLSVNSSGASTDVTIQEIDAAGSNIATPAYVTITLTGPGSFASGSALTSETLYLDGHATIPVYGEVGQPGIIQVSATGAGLQPGTVEIPTYVNTEPANITLSATQGTTANGTPFTLYTVQLVDTNGNPITTGANASDAITISDNTATVGGALVYQSVSDGQPSGIDLTSMHQHLTSGTFQFAVENTAVGTANPTITVEDTTEDFTATAPYTYQVGSPAQLAITNSATRSYVEAGTTYTVSAQLEDSNGNALTTAGQDVVFFFASNGSGATLPNGLSLTGATNGYIATTNGQGVASVTVNVPSSADANTSFVVDAEVLDGTRVAIGPSVMVEPAFNYATSMAFNSALPSTVTAGTPAASMGSQTVTLTNAVGERVNTNDQLQVTTSNPNVLTLSKYNSGSSNTDTVTAVSGAALLPSIKGEQAGTATITVTDLSNPTVAPISETVTVVAGAPSGGMFYLAGQPVNGSNPVTVAANTPVALTLFNTDAAGNPVPVTTTEANGAAGATFSLSAASGSFRLSPSGADVTTATIPVGQEGVTVYYVNGTAGSYSDLGATLTSDVPAIITPSVTGATNVTAGAGAGEPITFTVTDGNGNPVPDATVDFGVTGSLNAKDLSVATGTTNSHGQVSVTYTDTQAGDTGTVTATSEGVHAASGTLTVVPAAPANIKIGAATASGTYDYAWTVTVEDSKRKIAPTLRWRPLSPGYRFEDGGDTGDLTYSGR